MKPCGSRLAAAALLLLAALLPARAQQEPAPQPGWGLRITGLAGAPVAQGAGGSGRATVEPELKWRRPDYELRAQARLRALRLEGDERRDADVRELTLAWRRPDTTWTLGAQQLNWGRMDLVRVTDVVNPVDQHDLFLEELPESKLALWMANVEWQSEGRTLQFVATPQVPVDRLPRRWGGLPVDVARPGPTWRHGTAAVRAGFEAAGWNADLLAVHGWQALPVLRPAAGPAGLRLQGAVARQDSLGFSADRPIGGAVLRLEGLVARVAAAQPDGAAPVEGLRRTSLGAGLDLRFGDWFVAGQVIGQEERRRIEPDGRNAWVSVVVQRKWMQDRLAARALVLRETHGGSSWTSLQAQYEVSPHQRVQLQGDRFRGTPAQPLGAYAGRSRVAVSVRLDY